MWADVTTRTTRPSRATTFSSAAATWPRSPAPSASGSSRAHGEGWALYAERLMDELGWFRTPDTRLGFLSSQALRAVRVVIDIGLHLGRRVPAGLPGSRRAVDLRHRRRRPPRRRRPDRGVRPQRSAALLVVAGAGDVLQAGRAVLAGRSDRGPGRGRGIVRPARLARPRPGPRPARPRPPRAGARRALSRTATSPLRAPESTSSINRAWSRRWPLALASMASISSSDGVSLASAGTEMVIPLNGFLSISSSLTSQP